jgi:hypothetical protein
VGTAFPSPQDLFDVHVHLSEERRRYRIAVTLVGKDRQAALIAQGLENGFRDAKRETVEGANEDDALIAFVLSFQTPAESGDQLTKDGGRNVLCSLFEQE